jgi:NAD(P)-dependent dehydrogenase (short-subunit alcohol dehydrogenase family)
VSAVDLTDRVAIVTGAGNGLGRAHARALAAAGARVVVNDADEIAAKTVVEEILAAGDEAIACAVPVGTPEAAATLVDAALSTWGRLDAVVNNAGILRDMSIPKVTPEDFETVMRVHVMGSFYLAQAVFVHMKEQRYGRLVHTTSGGGVFGGFGQVSYAAAKSAITGMSKTFAIEGAKYGITSNCVAPLARTQMTGDIFGPLNERMVPEAVSPVVVYLASPQAQYSGEIFSAGGGRFARMFSAFTPGWTGGAEPTVDDVVAHLDAIRDHSTYTIANSGGDEVLQLMTELHGAS